MVSMVLTTVHVLTLSALISMAAKVRFVLCYSQTII